MKRTSPPQPSPRQATPKPAPRSQPTPEQPSPEPVRDQTEDEREHLRLAFWRSGRIAFVLAAIFLVVQLLAMVGGVVAAVVSVLLYAVFGGILAVVVAPLDRLFRRVMSPTPAALLAVLAAVAVIVLIGVGVGVPIAGQAHQLTSALPRLGQPFADVQQFLAAHGIAINLGSFATVLGISTSSGSIGTAVLSAVSFTARLVVDMLIVLVTTFWLLRDWATLRRGLLRVLPGTWRTETDFVLNAFVVVFGGYIRAQLLLAVLVGGLAGAGCFVIGVPFALVVAVAAAVFELIPLAGPLVGAAIGVLFALTVSPGLAAETVGVFIVIHVIEGYLVSPRIQGRFVRLHPLISLLALLAGVGAGGFLGAFFAVPVASLIAVIARARIADLRADQPDLFALAEGDAAVRGRRRTLLAEYRVRPGAVAKRLGRRISGLWSS